MIRPLGLPLTLVITLLAALLLSCGPQPLSPEPNSAPQFVFIPGANPARTGLIDTLTLGQSLCDTLFAIDPDNDSLLFWLDSNPDGATLVEQTLCWTPHEKHLGKNLFRAMVSDNRGGFDTLVWQVAVGDTNHPPLIMYPLPDYHPIVAVGSPWNDTLRGSDPDSDPLIFYRVRAPRALQTFDSLMSWTPTVLDTGTDTILFRLSDTRGGTDTIAWQITVIDTNHHPRFDPTSFSGTDSVWVGSLYQRQVAAADPDNDPLYYSLQTAPASAFLTVNTLNWRTNETDTGLHQIELAVTDSSAPADTISWRILVLDTNHTPRFRAYPGVTDTIIPVGSVLRTTLQAADPDNDPIHFVVRSEALEVLVGDSVVQISASQSVIGTWELSALVADSIAVGDSVFWTVTVIDTNHAPTFTVPPDSLSATLYGAEMYLRTLSATDPDNDSLTFSLLQAPDSFMLDNDTMRWTTPPYRAGEYPVVARVSDNRGKSDTLSWSITVRPNSPGCPPYTHLYDATEGDPAQLPQGYYLFTLKDRNGLYKSHVRTYAPVPIPNTQTDLVANPSISSNGEWIMYVDRRQYMLYLIRQDGTRKTKVPLAGTSYGQPRCAGFVRSSPYGDEIFYSASSAELRAIKVLFTADTVFLGNERTLVDLSGSEPLWILVSDPLVDISVVGDQVMGRFENWVSGARCSRTEFLTIPNNGLGVGTAEHIYRWKDDDYLSIDGCGHTMSHDGALALLNVPWYLEQITPCVPVSHKGVAITPFRRVNDPPLNLYNEHYLTDATSLNWCPPAYRANGDFWAWYFSNDSRYCAARHYVDGNSANGVWVLEWQTNTWTRLTPRGTSLDIVETALYFGTEGFGAGDTIVTDTADTTSDTDPFNPHLKMVTPNGGEVFYVNEPCTIRVSSTLDAAATISIYSDSADYNFRIPGLNGSINPRSDSLIIFTMPDSISVYRYNPQSSYPELTRISTVSPWCRAVVADYQDPVSYNDESDAHFSIRVRE